MLPLVARSEDAAIPMIGKRIAEASTVYADDASAWDILNARFSIKRINHSECYSDGDGSGCIYYLGGVTIRSCSRLGGDLNASKSA